MPAYQVEAVMAYIAAAESSGKVPANATSFFNHSGRAYPDLAAVATPYNVYCDGFVNVTGRVILPNFFNGNRGHHLEK